MRKPAAKSRDRQRPGLRADVLLGFVARVGRTPAAAHDGRTGRAPQL